METFTDYSYCNSMGEGSRFVLLDEVDSDLGKCTEYCLDELGDDLAVALLDEFFFGQCLW